MVSHARRLQPGYDRGVVLIEAFGVVSCSNGILLTEANVGALGRKKVALLVATMLSLLGLRRGIDSYSKVSEPLRLPEEGLTGDIRGPGSVGRVGMFKRSVSTSFLFVDPAMLNSTMTLDATTGPNDMYADEAARLYGIAAGPIAMEWESINGRIGRLGIDDLSGCLRNIG